jgi:hypothetical protein
VYDRYVRAEEGYADGQEKAPTAQIFSYAIAISI